MKREIVITKDGSSTIYISDWEESYHSKHGAIQEAKHVFIKNGFSLFSQKKEIKILEIGFGTGLNALITSIVSKEKDIICSYIGVDAYPIEKKEWQALNYSKELVGDNLPALFQKMHEANWNEEIEITSHFKLTKRKQFFQDIQDSNQFDLIYYDAFGFRVQPELWDVSVFKKMFAALKQGGVLVTYACRTPIRNAMIAAGFRIEKLPGAPGKREMLRATKE